MTTPHALLHAVMFSVDDLLGTSVTDGVQLNKDIVQMVYREQNHEIQRLGSKVRNLH